MIRARQRHLALPGLRQQGMRFGDRLNAAFDFGGECFRGGAGFYRLGHHGRHDRQDVLYAMVELTQQQTGLLLGCPALADVPRNH